MASDGKDRGTMAAMFTSKENAETLIAEKKLDVVLANHNTPEQVVRSGSTEGINSALQVFKIAGIRGQKLTVGGAFHSPLMADSTEPFAEFVKGMKWNKLEKSVYANTTGTKYPTSGTEGQNLLSSNLFLSEICGSDPQYVRRRCTPLYRSWPWWSTYRSC